MKKVLLLNTLYSPNTGGIENSLRHLALEFLRRGYEPIIVASDINNETADKLPLHEVGEIVEVCRYRSPNLVAKPLFRIAACVMLLRSLRRKQHFDLVISRSSETTIAASLAGFKNVAYIPGGIAKVQHLENHSIRGAKFWLKLSFEQSAQKLACRLAKRRVLVFSRSMLNGMAAMSPSAEATLVRPGVDMERFFPVDGAEKRRLRKKLNLPEEKKVYLCLARLVPLKNYEKAIEMAVLLRPDEHVVVVGDGPSKADLQRLVQQLNVESKVTFYPSTPEPESYYKAADRFLMLSRSESFGQTLLEATAAGLPVVAFSSSAGVQTATEEIYSGYYHLIRFVHSQSPEALLKAIRTPESRNSEQFKSERKEFLRSYSWGGLSEELIERGQTANCGWSSAL